METLLRFAFQCSGGPPVLRHTPSGANVLRRPRRATASHQSRPSFAQFQFGQPSPGYEDSAGKTVVVQPGWEALRGAPAGPGQPWASGLATALPRPGQFAKGQVALRCAHGQATSASSTSGAVQTLRQPPLVLQAGTRRQFFEQDNSLFSKLRRFTPKKLSFPRRSLTCTSRPTLTAATSVRLRL
jgi:hypothetical protein